MTACIAALVFLPIVQADTFVYDNAGRLLTSVQATGLNHAYSYDEEANLLSISHSAADTTGSGGAGNGLPDWWENVYFGATGQNPLGQPTTDGLSSFLKFSLGQSPQVAATGAPLTKTFTAYTDGKTYPMLTFVRAKDAASMLVPEQSVSGGAWQSGGSYFVTVSINDLGNGTERVVVRSLTALPAAGNLAFRLKALDNATGTTDATQAVAASTGVPTMPGWSFILLIGLLLTVAVSFLRQKSATSAHAAS
ncbi:MAG TPA: RHS repeat domain-containing protein [Rariglobus sp.]